VAACRTTQQKPVGFPACGESLKPIKCLVLNVQENPSSKTQSLEGNVTDKENGMQKNDNLIP